MMLDDLVALLADGRIGHSRSPLLDAIEMDNVLGKRSANGRKQAARHLAKLYTLDSTVPLYRAFTFLWQRDSSSRPLLAFLVAHVRDAILRSCAPFLFNLKPGDTHDRESLEVFIDQLNPGRFSPVTLKSTAKNLRSTWTQAGYLCGRVNKVRQFVEATPASVTLALLLGFVTGSRGALLFESEYIKLLDSPPSTALERAEEAAQSGWINLKRIGSVVEVDFPRLLNAEQRELLLEQD